MNAHDALLTRMREAVARSRALWFTRRKILTASVFW